ncbi:hypothetical protein BXP70_14300 [Hymenobacter crusticola]|uniref:Outer membrane protein beta-barrel domain-containing protein n=1 Tax=Hymenobacter crusticola TaxID=1770526 RepID=A0A243WC43_9BACT|nr:hypothetical protein BXP70_14300 [Hymenobacter crusticola]
MSAGAATAQSSATYAKTAQALPTVEPAPEPIDLRLSLGTTYDGEGAYRCTRVALEFAPAISKNLGTVIRLASVVGRPNSLLERQAPNQNYKSAYLEQESVFYPFGIHKRIRLGIGVGGFVGYYEKNTYAYLKAVAGKLTDYSLVSREGMHAGLVGSLNLDVAIDAAQRWHFGIKSAVENGIGSNRISPAHSLTVARRL